MIDFLIYTALAVLACYRLTFDYNRRWDRDDGSYTQLEGPFKLYEWARGFMLKEFWPEWIRAGSGCYYCTSFWFGSIFALIVMLATYTGPLWLWPFVYILLSYAVSAPTVWWASRSKLQFDQDPQNY